jgi:hypothetical protein
LKASGQVTAFESQDAIALKSCLGFYCDLQSLRSEDAITWSFFGNLRDHAADFLNWLLPTIQVKSKPSETCNVWLWRRLPHPDTGKRSQGPEADFALVGDRSIVLGEAKWRDREKTKQGVLGDTSQMAMRRRSLVTLNDELGGGRQLVALGVVRTGTLEEPPPDAPEVSTRIIEWSELTKHDAHPLASEFRRYLAWKARYG